jgi:hypothetical protein
LFTYSDSSSNEEWLPSEREKTPPRSFAEDIERKVGDTGPPRRQHRGDWSKVKRKTARAKGAMYVTAKGVVVPEKKCKENPCKNSKCQNKCNEFSEEERRQLCAHYWDLQDTKRQRDFLSSCIKIADVKRRRTEKGDGSRRHSTYEYYMKKGNDEFRVCKQFMLATLDIGKKNLLSTL